MLFPAQSDFSETILSKSTFDNCDLKYAIFDQTNIENANFITAFNFEINPSKNKIKKAKFSETFEPFNYNVFFHVNIISDA